MNADLARALYFRELDARVQQDARVGTYVTALSATGAAIWFVLGNAWPARTFLGAASVACAAFSAVAFLGALGFVLTASVGYQYQTSATANEILEYWGSIRKYHEAHQSIPGTAEKEFDEFLIRKFCDAATNNAQVAKTRSERFHYAGRLLTGAVVLVALSGITLTVDKAFKKAPGTRRDVVSDPTNTPSPAPAPTAPVVPAAPATPVASLPPRPAEPQNIIVKGGAERTPNTTQMAVPTPRKP